MSQILDKMAGNPDGPHSITPEQLPESLTSLIPPKQNPFPSKFSGYGRPTREGIFFSVYPEGSPMRAFHLSSHAYVEAFIKDSGFPCILGQTAVRTDQYTFGAYPDMTDPNIAEGMLHDVVRFQNEFKVPDQQKGERGIFRTFLAAFQNKITDELQGAEVLYILLQNMHEINSKHYGWAPGFSNDLDSPDFGFSAGRSAHFIAFFHPHANVPARVSDETFLVFNSHHVVDAFKATGMDNHARAKAIIRSRQQQPIHPYLGNHREANEWRQYALLNPDPETEAAEAILRRKILGECPFQPDKKINPDQQ